MIDALHRLKDPAPNKTIVVGDTRNDIEAARKIGIKTIALLCGGRPEKELVAAGAIAIYRDPADLLEQSDECPIAILYQSP